MMNLSITSKILLSVLILAALATVGYFIYQPLSRSIEQERFTVLDNNQRDLYQALIDKSAGTDKWSHAADCKQIYSGSLPTGEYTCSTTISTSKDISSVDQLNAMRDKYFGIIDNNKYLNQESNLDRQKPDDFGKKFVVSSEEKHYKDSTSNIVCRYILALEQSSETTSNFSYGSVIKNTGILKISVVCSDKTVGEWY